MTISFTEKEYMDFCRNFLQIIEKEVLSATYSVVGMSEKQEDEIHAEVMLKVRNWFSYLNLPKPLYEKR